MVLSREHTSTKADDVTKLLLLNKIPVYAEYGGFQSNCNPNPIQTQTPT